MRSLPPYPVRLGFAYLLSVGLCTAGQVEVVADRVNLRACASADCEVVAQVSRGQILTSLPESTAEWVAVVPPENTVFWVYAELISEDVVAVEDLRVRGGPGINYRPVGRMDKGDRVSVLGRDGDWLRITPPPGSSLWISAPLVKPLGASTVEPLAPAMAEVPSTRTLDPLPSVPVVTATPPTSGSGLIAPVKPRTTRAPDVRGAAVSRVPDAPGAPPPSASDDGKRRVKYSGVVRPAGMAVWRQPSRYRLVAFDSLGRVVTRCYIVADERALARHEGQQVEITGIEYGVQGVRFPVVKAETLQRISRE